MILSKETKLVCELTWGCVPLDHVFIYNSKLYQENLKKYKEGHYNNLLEYIK